MSNNDIENDFDTEDFDTDGFDDGGFDDLNSQKGTLGDLWRNNPLVKIGVILAAFAFLVGGVILFGGKKEDLAVSQFGAKKDVKEAVGSSELTDDYLKQIEAGDVNRTEDAIRNSGSVMPMPTGQAKGAIDMPLDEPAEEDPLERWRRMQEERIKQQQVETRQEEQQPVAPPVDTRTPAINALSQAMSQQMESVLGNQKINSPTIQTIASISYLEGLAEKERKKLEEALAAQNLAGLPLNEDDYVILLAAGTIEYAQLLTEANTDAPGPILAQIATGPLKGGRLIGSFTATDNYLTLNFSTIVLDGVDYAAEGIAIDPDTTLPGVITEIDRRYLKRIALPMAAEFVTGLAEAISDSGTTSITISGDSVTQTTSNSGRSNDQEVASGVTAAGEEFSSIIDEIVSNTKPMLRVAAGTPIGVLFISPVLDTPKVVQQREQQRDTSTPQPYYGTLPPFFYATPPAGTPTTQSSVDPSGTPTGINFLRP